MAKEKKNQHSPHPEATRFDAIAGLLRSGAAKPPARLREQVLSRLRQNQPSVKDAALAQLETIRENDRQWKETRYAGIWICNLFDDAPKGNGAILVKMTAGAIYPDHRHKAREQFYVIQGDVRVGNDTLHAGDYHRAEGATYHRQVSTERGCMCIILGYVGSISALK